MGTLIVVEVDPIVDNLSGCEAIGQFKEIDGLIFEGAPQAFNENVVHATTPAIHRDFDFCIFEHSGKVGAGELAALIGIENLRFAVSGQGFMQSFNAETGVQCVNGVLKVYQ